MKKVIIDGNEACANASYLLTETAGIYPITPSSPMPEFIDNWNNSGKKNIFGNSVNVIEMQSEAGASGLVHGLLQSGILTSTYTASQGLMLMIPNMYKIAGEMLPCVMHVASRTVATHALSIFGDHSDVYQARDTGFCMLASTNVQDAYYLSLISHLSAISSSLPFVHFFDGFRTSHELSQINIFSEEEIKQVKQLIDLKSLNKFRNKALNINKPNTKGTNQNGDIYFQICESRNKNYNQVADKVNEYMSQINKIAKTNYKPFNYYGDKKAKKVIIAMGSVCDTIKETIDYLKDNVGLIEVHLYRPFSIKYLLDVLPKTVQKIAVLDMSKSIGGMGEPLYLDVVSALKDTNIKIVGGRYGLSSKNTTPGMIKAVYDSLDKPINNFTIGIEDDVTHLSLSYLNLNTSQSLEYLIYGYGSDGMVSASKSIMKIAGKNNHVQGYFEYDSRKSGGVTVGHLRFSNKNIKSSYYVTHPKFVALSKDTYLNDFDIISNIQDNGIFLINTSKSEKELLNLLGPYKKKLIDSKIKVYAIDASKVALKHDLGRKISMIMESAIISLMDFINYDEALEEMKTFIKTRFKTKGDKIINSNIEAITDINLKQIKIDNKIKEKSKGKKDLYSIISRREGNNLKVSQLLEINDGAVIHTNIKSSPITDTSIKWDKAKCIQCGQCSFVCPHGVIRTYILDQEEYNKAPESIKSKCVDAIGLKNYYFTIGVAKDKCTGCGVCVSTCPGKKGEKALSFEDYVTDDDFEYLEKNIKEKNLFNKNTVKGSQLIKPKFAFHGACSGCGQTAYIKLLTQLFGDNLIISNATGCSSIYGASMPSIPYEIPWANSLFEDNAEFGYGILKGYEKGQELVKSYMKEKNNPLFEKWLKNIDDYEITKEIASQIDYNKYPELKALKNYLVKPIIWTVGGDGWAYDIGYGGIDHVLASGDNVNILVLDTQVYSNTGGQSSKATPMGAISKFASSGKKNTKKDLARLAMTYDDVYVAQVSLGANMMQTIKALNEATLHKGPSIVIAYTPCISHGIIDGMGQSVNMEALATKCGYFPIFRKGDKFNLDAIADFDLYNDFLMKQTRYAMLSKVNPLKADELLKSNKDNAIKRYNYYKKLADE